MRRLGNNLLEAFEAEQDRWFLWVPVCFGIGIAVYFALLFEPRLMLACAMPIVAFALSKFWQHGAPALLFTSALLAATLGFAVTKLRSEMVAAPVIARQTGPIAVTGWVELVEPRPARGQRLTIRVASIEGLAGGSTPERVRVRTFVADPSLKPGDAIAVKSVLSPPAGPALPGGFDFARSAWFQGLGGVGYAREAATRVVITKPKPFDLVWRGPIERVRQAIGQRIQLALPGETGAIANALVTGERGGISDATNDAFRDSGLFHILSISGLHMVIMAGAVFLTVRFLLTLSPRLALNYPIKKWAATAAAIGALAYLLISGASFPTVRSYIMISFMFLAVLLDRPAVALRNVALAALLILIVYPESLIDVGFQMSFAAVVALVAAYEMIRDRERPGSEGRGRSMLRGAMLFFGGIILSTLVASLSVAPLAAYHFHKSQQYAIIANLIAIPLCNAIVMPAALAALVAMPFGLEAWPLKLMGLGIEGMVWCAYKVAALPGAVGRIPEIPTLAFALMVAGGLWLCLWRTRLRYWGSLAIVAGGVVAPMRTVPDVFVGRDGLVAVRDKSGRLSALSPRGATFELARILEHDGDDRRPQDVAKGDAFRCDWSGCIADVRGNVVAVTRQPLALADDCRKAAIVIFPGKRANACAGTAVPGPVDVVDAPALAKSGATTVQFTPGPRLGHATVQPHRMTTVAATRGERPWTYRAQPISSAIPGAAIGGSQSTTRSGAPGSQQGGTGADMPPIETPPQRRHDPDDDP